MKKILYKGVEFNVEDSFKLKVGMTLIDGKQEVKPEVKPEIKEEVKNEQVEDDINLKTKSEIIEILEGLGKTDLDKNMKKSDLVEIYNSLKS